MVSVIEDAHARAVSYLISNCRDLALVSVLVYGSYARGDYRPDSDIDLLMVLDSKRYSSRDLRSLVKICRFCREEFKVSLQMDIILDSEIDLWNHGVLLDGHSFIDLSFYRKEGKVLLGEDVRERFKLPVELKEKARVVLGIIEAEFKRWYLGQEGEACLVPHWMTGWLLVTFLNTLGTVDVASFKETCESVEKIPALSASRGFQKYREKKELTADEFIELHKVVKNEVQRP